MSKTLKQSTLIIMGFSIITRLTSFFFKVYLSRRVGAETLGIYQMCISIFALLTNIAVAGISTTLSRRTAELTAHNETRKIQGLLGSSSFISLGIAIFTIFMFVIFRKPLLGLFSDSRCRPLFMIMLPALISTVMYFILRGYFMGKQRYIEYSTTELAEEILKIVITVLLLSNIFWCFDDGKAIAVAFTITDILVMLLLLIIFFIIGGKFAKPVETKKLIKSSLPITMVRVSASLISSLITIIIPMQLVKSGMNINMASAEYGRAVGMAFPLLFAPLSITSALSIVLLPQVATLAAKGQHNEIARKIDGSLTFIVIITGLFYALYLALGKSYGFLLFKDRSVGTFISFAAGMVIPMSMTQLVCTSLNSLGEEKKCFFVFVISSAVLLILIYTLPKYIGIYALAVAETAFYIIHFSLGSIVLINKKAMNVSFFRPVILVGISSMLTALSARLTYNIFIRCLSEIWATLFASALACSIYGILMMMFKLVKLKTLRFAYTKKKKPRNKTQLSKNNC